MDGSKDSSTLETLPDEPLMRIMLELELKDLLNLRRISKRFACKVGQIAPEELAYDFYCLERNWSHTEKPVKNKIIIPFASRINPKYALIRWSVIFTSPPPIDLTGLKRLRFAYAMMPNQLSSLVGHINKFVRLEQLEFLDKHVHGSHLTLRLPELLVLFVYSLVDGQLNVEAPKLRVLRCECPLAKIRLKTPTSVHDLHLAFFDPELPAYRNVELLTVQQAYPLPICLAYNLMNRLHHLKELRIQYPPSIAIRTGWLSSPTLATRRTPSAYWWSNEDT